MNTETKTEAQSTKLTDAAKNQNLREIAHNLSNDVPLEVLTKMLLDANTELNKRLGSEKKVVLDEICALVKKHKISLEDITKALEKNDALFRANDALKARNMYRDPESGNFWNGVGRKPNWLVRYEENGVDTTQFVIGGNQLSSNLTPHFYNPKKPQQRWNGYGRKPEWFIKMKDKGIDAESFVIYL
ncbi:H-NS histone family protein [Acinetobacter sp. ANC 5380]|uniref:H-NS histone family protein n=1 Tax=Acinetobacter terrae TaxID=2731247 RepID=A0A7Y2RD01_9GAMM|nr:H-NS family nucleoid-associated regulatory protein [Acinetobacter terrae]NNH76485.1 H-NS histone family protein [Acinetobacter terrae]